MLVSWLRYRLNKHAALFRVWNALGSFHIFQFHFMISWKFFPLFKCICQISPILGTDIKKAGETKTVPQRLMASQRAWKNTLFCIPWNDFNLLEFSANLLVSVFFFKVFFFCRCWTTRQLQRGPIFASEFNHSSIEFLPNAEHWK